MIIHRTRERKARNVNIGGQVRRPRRDSCASRDPEMSFPSIRPSIHPSIHPYNHPPTHHPSVHLPIHPPTICSAIQPASKHLFRANQAVCLCSCRESRNNKMGFMGLGSLMSHWGSSLQANKQGSWDKCPNQLWCREGSSLKAILSCVFKETRRVLRKKGSGGGPPGSRSSRCTGL